MSAIFKFGDTLIPTDPEINLEAEMTEDKLLRIEGQKLDLIDVATHEFGASNLRGLQIWQIDMQGERFTIAEIIAKVKERSDA